MLLIHGIIKSLYLNCEKRWKDIKILLTVLLLRKWLKKRILYLIYLSISNSFKCKMKLTGHWYRYNNTQNVTSLSKFCFYILLQTWPGHCLVSESDLRQVFTPFICHCTITQRCFQHKNAQKWHTPSHYDKNLAVKHWQRLQH